MRRRRVMTSWFVAATLCAPLCTLSVAGDGPKPAEVIDSIPPPPEKTDTAEVVESIVDTPAGRSDQPRVVIAADGEAHPGCWFKLDGAASKDSLDAPTGGELQFEWKQASGPLVHLTDAETHSPALWLFLIQPGTYRFSLKVTNSAAKSASKELHFTVQPGRAFLTEAEGRKIVGFGEKVLLPGEGWRQVTGGPLDLRQEEEGAVFRPARAGLYIFEAPRAGDIPERRGVVVPPGREAPFGDRRPIAILPKNLLGKAGSPVLIDASLSRDPDGAEETAQLKAIWITNEKHRGVEIEELPNLRARFKAPRPGTYEVALVVSDGRLCSDPPEKVFIKLEEAEDNADPDGIPIEPVFEVSGARGDVRLTKVRLGLWDNLDRAVQLFPTRCGVALRVDPALCRPENFKNVPLALEVQDGALVHLVDWIGRQTDSVYRREEQVSFWFTRRDAWIKDEPLRPTVGQADALSAKPDGSDLMELLKPWSQKILDERPGSSLIYYRESQSIVGTLPAPAAGRLKEIIAALHQPAGDGLPPPEPPSQSEFKLRKTLGQKTVTIKEKNFRLDLLLRDLARQAGVAIGMDPRRFPKGLPHLNLNIEDAPLRDALRTIIDMAGFDGCSVEAPDGLWLYRGSAPYPGSELLSDCAFVQAYDLSRLLPRIAPMSGELIAHAIQQRIYPDSWSDPSALIFYHPPTGKLLVMHGAAVHRRILEFLWDLAERGEWALGPVEEGKK